VIWGEGAEAKDEVIVKGGAAGGGAGVAEERRHHRRAPHEDHCPAQGQRAYAPLLALPQSPSPVSRSEPSLYFDKSLLLVCNSIAPQSCRTHA
jgi:hypothetical protein